MQNRYYHNKALTKTAKMLRRNMTKEEKKLWYDYLAVCPVKFYRQKVIGNYIVDFYSKEANLVIELDGLQHTLDKVIEYDNERTKYLNSLGLEVIRFSNYEVVNDFIMVCDYICNKLKEKLPK